MTIVGISVVIVSALGLGAYGLAKQILEPGQDGHGAIPNSQARNAAILADPAPGDRCAKKIFDNATGPMLDVEMRCDGVNFDADGRPIYRGTMQRLDGIRNSFQKR